MGDPGKKHDWLVVYLAHWNDAMLLGLLVKIILV